MFALHLGAAGALTPAAGTALAGVIPRATGLPAEGSPDLGLRFQVTGLTGTYVGGISAFQLGIDAGADVGNGTSVRISYDLTGDGTWDRVEAFHYAATDPVPGWEQYTQASGLSSVQGTFGDLRGGTVRVEVWNVIGSAPTSLDLQGSTVTLPFR